MFNKTQKAKDAEAITDLEAPIALTLEQIAEVAAGTASHIVVDAAPPGTKGGIRVAS